MATLAETLIALTEENDLSGLSVHIGRVGDDRRVTWHSYAHWLHAAGRCASAYGDTPEEALAKVVAEANALRGRGVIIPEAIDMADLPESLVA